MNFAGFVVSNLLYHVRGNLAVLAGIALGAAVLTGALLVGDSLRGSLLAMSLDQLGWVEEVLAPGRLVTQDLVTAIPAKGRRAGVLLLQGSASLADGANAEKRPDDDAVRANILGVDAAFWETKDPVIDWNGTENVVAISESLARDLNAKVGDSLWLNVPKSDAIPRESLLGKRKSGAVVDAISVTVKQVLPADGMGRFTMQPSPEPARNAFVPLALLQDRLTLAGRVNLILISGAEPVDMKATLSLRDWGLKLTTPEERAKALVWFLDERNKTGNLKKNDWLGRIPDELVKRADAKGNLTEANIVDYYRRHRNYLMLQSDHLYLDATVEAALAKAFDLSEPKYRPVLIYLADRVAFQGAEEPYATVAAVRPGQVPGSDGVPLEDGQIRLVQWPESRLKPKVGDLIELDYFFPEAGHRLGLKSKTFRFAGFVPMAGAVDDPDWTPEFPGLTDKLDIAGWDDPPFPPYSTRKLMERISKADEDYWKRYRATPKAYVTLADGQKLWETRFGKLTELRIDLPERADAKEAAACFSAALRQQLDPEKGGFVVQNLRKRAEEASTGSADFGGLFLGFSFFLILSALVLVGLLVRLNLERRAPEIGLLWATGWGATLVGEVAALGRLGLILVGAGLGLVGARVFADAMLRLLAVNWPGEGTLQFLKLHATAKSYAIGFVVTAVVSAITLWWAYRILRKRSPRELLAGCVGDTAAVASGSPLNGLRWKSFTILVVAIFGAAGSLVGSVFAKGHEAQAGAFLGGGFFLLTALLTLVWRWLTRADGRSQPRQTVLGLGIRNARRNPVRSLLTIGLLASATFLIVAVQSFHREPAETFFQKDGGSGGFRLVVQTDIPLYEDLNDSEVRDEVGVPPVISAMIEDVQSFRLQPGDDASCLNLYQPLKPRLLGVPETLVRANRFAFAASLAETEDEKANPWLLLDKPTKDGAVPAILDANSAQWILKVGLGETLKVKSQAGDEVPLRIVGLLKESLFQSEVLAGESAFLKLFPGQQGDQFFLIACPAAKQKMVSDGLKAALATKGADVRTTFERLSAYLAVENTYLSTFQALGGLGLLLGAVGLAIVLVRGVWERRAELALLRAVGFRNEQIGTLVFGENAALLLLGLAVGGAAALVTIAPQLLGGQATLFLMSIAKLVGTVAAVGLIAGAGAMVMSLRTPVLTALRRE